MSVRNRLETVALLAFFHRDAVAQKNRLFAMVDAFNDAARLLNSGQYRLEGRQQAVLNLHRRANNICRQVHLPLADRVNEMSRVANELAGVLANYNKDNPHYMFPVRHIDQLRGN